jgi:hypothetical protein
MEAAIHIPFRRRESKEGQYKDAITRCSNGDVAVGGSYSYIVA